MKNNMAWNFWLSGWFSAATAYQLIAEGSRGAIVVTSMLGVLFLSLGLQKLRNVKVD